jgi:TetR/AcrR family transcriptional regulator, repressor for uid operon
VNLKPDLTTDPLAERRTAILDAAERCFVQHGFHRATMQDLARMAGMSVGNLYRYFPAKDAVVLALAERDRAEAARHFCDEDVELWPALAHLIRHFLVEAPREKAVLLVEVWAEATRNPTIAAMIARFDAENHAWIAEGLRTAAALTDAEVEDLVDRIHVEVQGIHIARALSAAYDPRPAVDRLIAGIEAKLATAAPLHPSSSRLEAAE